MRLWAKPTPHEIAEFLDRESLRDFTYQAVGGTSADAPQGYDVHRNRILLGHGQQAYSAACKALNCWQMFPKSWTEIHPTGVEPKLGMTVAVLVNCWGRWWLNSARIVYHLDTDDDKSGVDESALIHRFGFAYGTLPGHVECGEERFMIEWDEQDQVWYEIYSFSRPRHWLVRLAYPLAKLMQKRFIRESMAQFRTIVTQQLQATTEPFGAEADECEQQAIPVA